MGQERRERIAGLCWFGGEVGLLSSTTLFLSLAVLLLCFCALEEVSLREKTSAVQAYAPYLLATWELSPLVIL